MASYIEGGRPLLISYGVNRNDIEEGEEFQ